MKQLILVITIFFIVQESKAGDTITAVKAKSYIGKEVTLCDRVNYGRYLNVSKKQPTILWVGPDYPNHYLYLVFPKESLRMFSFDPEKKMINKRFCVKGKIEKFRGKPAIYIRSESQLNEEE
ncbi:MAG: hypothetical protein WKF91_22970 [Segetibacter sp.]|jgi:hypothetical protein